MKVAISVALLLSYSAILAAQQAQVAGRDVALTVIRAQDRATLSWPSGAIELRTISATTSTDENVYMMLEHNGIAPDSQALTLVYDLNPSVSDVDALPANSSLLLPALAGGDRLRSLLEQKDLVRLTLDPDLRGAICESAEALQGYASSIPALTSDPASQRSLQDLLGWYAVINRRLTRRTDPPLRRDTLIELRDEGRLLRNILEQSKSQGVPLSPSQQAQISAIHDDLSLTMPRFGQTLSGAAPKAEDACDVKVIIKDGPPGIVDNLRVYFQYNGLYFPPPPASPPATSLSFNGTGAQTSRSMSRKNYQIWAARDGDPTNPVTPPHALFIDSSAVSPVTVDLTYTGAAHK